MRGRGAIIFLAGFFCGVVTLALLQRHSKPVAVVQASAPTPPKAACG